MPRQAVNPRRFSREDLDPHEPAYVHVAFRVAPGSENLFEASLKTVLQAHPGIHVIISGLVRTDASTRITVGVYLGSLRQVMGRRTDPYTLQAAAVLPHLFTRMFDFWPHLVVQPDADEALQGHQCHRAFFGPRARVRVPRALQVLARDTPDTLDNPDGTPAGTSDGTPADSPADSPADGSAGAGSRPAHLATDLTHLDAPRDVTNLLGMVS